MKTRRSDSLTLKELNEAPPWDWPRGTRDLLLRTLRDTRAGESDRVIAAEMAGDLVVMNDDLANALLAIVRSADAPEKLRAQAAISLGPVLEQGDTQGFDDPDDPDIVPVSQQIYVSIQDNLRQLFNDPAVPREVRRRALESSVRAPQEWHTEAIRTAWSSPDDKWKLTAAFCMRYVAGFDKEILEALTSRKADIHYEAILAAGDRQVDAAWPHISKLLTSGTKKRLLLAAIGAAGSIRPQEARRTLGEFLESEDEDIADAAMDALSMAEASLELDEDDELDDEDDEEDDDQDFAPRA